MTHAAIRQCYSPKSAFSTVAILIVAVIVILVIVPSVFKLRAMFQQFSMAIQRNQAQSFVDDLNKHCHEWLAAGGVVGDEARTSDIVYVLGTKGNVSNKQKGVRQVRDSGTSAEHKTDLPEAVRKQLDVDAPTAAIDYFDHIEKSLGYLTHNYSFFFDHVTNTFILYDWADPYGPIKYSAYIPIHLPKHDMAQMYSQENLIFEDGNSFRRLIVDSCYLNAYGDAVVFSRRSANATEDEDHIIAVYVRGIQDNVQNKLTIKERLAQKTDWWLSEGIKPMHPAQTE